MMESKKESKKRQKREWEESSSDADDEKSGQFGDGNSEEVQTAIQRAKVRYLKREAMVSLVPDLEEWDPSSLPDGFFAVIEGKRRTGKSTFALWMLQWYIDKFALVICMTHTLNAMTWQPHVGSNWTFYGYNPRIIEMVIKQNDEIMKKHGGEKSPESWALGHTLFILDDIIEPSLYEDPWFTKLATEGRHYLCSVMVLIQDPKAIRPAVRDNTDLVTVFNQRSFRDRQSLWHDYMQDLDWALSQAFIDKYCVEHNALIVVQSNLNNVIKRNFQKSTIDKSELKYPNYVLGSDAQKKEIIKENTQRKEEEKQLKARQKADKRPLKKRTDMIKGAEKFTVEEVERGSGGDSII
jgi:hypothetical protein